MWVGISGKHGGAESPDEPATEHGPKVLPWLLVTLTISFDERMKAHEKERKKSRV